MPMAKKLACRNISLYLITKAAVTAFANISTSVYIWTVTLLGKQECCTLKSDMEIQAKTPYLFNRCKYLRLSDPVEQCHFKEIMFQMLPNRD